MKNHADKTNEEINIEVAELRGVNWWLPPSNSSSGGWEYCKIPELITKQDCKLPDYCNSWADAGPVIAENMITVACGDCGSAWSTAGGIIGGVVRDKNPLRAAMIVFLMMKDNETRILAPGEVSDA